MPEQQNSPLSDTVVEQLEKAGKQAVSQKMVDRHKEVLKSVLSGLTVSTGGSNQDTMYYVVVIVNAAITNVQEPVETDLGPASIESVYTANDEGTARVSVGFNERQLQKAKSRK